MRTPKLWKSKNIFSIFLFPLSLIYGFFRKIHKTFSKEYKSKKLNIICIGNLTAGGNGKTPVAIKIGEIFKQNGKNFAYLSKGYKGKINDFVKVDGKKHTYLDVGDEPLLLSKIADTFVCKNRKKAIQILENKYNYDFIIMDDGFQNPTIYKNKNIIIVDGEYGIGNGFLLPAGPLRENLKDAIKRIDFVIIIGNDRQNLEEYFLKNNIKVFKANIKEKIKNIDNNQKYIAFSGIGRPEKFFNSLKKVGCNVIKEISFEDHHIYTNNEIEKILLTAKKENAKVITTSKDWIKLAKNYQNQIDVLEIEIDLLDKNNFLKEIL